MVFSIAGRGGGGLLGIWIVGCKRRCWGPAVKRKDVEGVDEGHDFDREQGRRAGLGALEV